MAANFKFLCIWKNIGVYGSSAGIIRNFSKHYNPKFRFLRRKKFEATKYDIDLPKDEKEKYIKRTNGLVPCSLVADIPYYVGSTLEIFDPYVPKQGDGKFSSIFQKESITSTVSKLPKNYLSARQIKKLDPDFDTKDFAHLAKDIYINAHEALARNNRDELLQFVTENAFNLMTANSKNRTIKWKFIESLDPPTTVRVRVSQLSTKNNLFGQVTVRLHSKQMLAIYDRFGRLIYGSEILAKDVLEYAVFEKHLNNVYGRWKLHHKIIPDWVPRDLIIKTYPKLLAQDADEDADEDLEVKKRRDLLADEEEEQVAEVVKK